MTPNGERGLDDFSLVLSALFMLVLFVLTLALFGDWLRYWLS